MTTGLMNPEVKVKWLAALRSGDYEQGKSSLRSADDEFCCLGVLCDLAVKEGVIPEPEEEGGLYYYDVAYHAGLPPVVSEWSGVTGLGGRPSGGERLAFVNDEGTPFNDIADIIEKEL